MSWLSFCCIEQCKAKSNVARIPANCHKIIQGWKWEKKSATMEPCPCRLHRPAQFLSQSSSLPLSSHPFPIFSVFLPVTGWVPCPDPARKSGSAVSCPTVVLGEIWLTNCFFWYIPKRKEVAMWVQANEGSAGRPYCPTSSSDNHRRGIDYHVWLGQLMGRPKGKELAFISFHSTNITFNSIYHYIYMHLYS